MQFLKVLGLLSFLVTGSLASAPAVYEELHFREDSSNSSQFHEVLQGLGESILIGHSNLHAQQLNSDSGTEDFFFRGFNSARKANDYIRYSVTIKPGLSIGKIIFPFHTFL